MTDMKVAKRSAEQIQALSEPNRIRIIDCLMTGSKNVTELSDKIKIPIVNASHHLATLRNAGLVTDDKQGRFVYYTLNHDLFSVDKKGKATLKLEWCTIEIS